ncbi:MAG: hypothetical protein LBS83_01660, partial [Holosporales bacterium]|nr:hypothetical protein [Holosporales bacterium]
MGICCKKIKLNDKALFYFNEAQKHGKTDRKLNAEIIPLINKNENPKMALEVLLKLEKTELMTTTLASDIAFCYLKLDQYKDSLKYLLKATELGRSDSWINENVGFVLGKLGKTQEA